MDKFSELKAAAMAATPGRIGDRIDGSGSIKYECKGYDGSLVLRTNHKDMEYGFVGDNADSDELFFRLCVPDVVLELLSDNEHLARELVARNGEIEWLRKRAAELEAKLATPVRLPETYSPDPWMGPDPSGTWLDKEDVKESILAAGFTVEGDE